LKEIGMAGPFGRKPIADSRDRFDPLKNGITAVGRRLSAIGRTGSAASPSH
jgi:hypothetical protein